MKKLKIFVGIAMFFIVGALSGSIGTGIYVRYKIDQYIKNGSPLTKYYLMNHVIHKLDLSNDQKIEFEKVVNKIQEDINKLREKHRPEAETILSEGFKEIEKQLNTEQKQKLDKIKAKRNK